MSGKNIKWLYSELSGLIDRGVITSDVANKIRAHYGDEDLNSGRRIALTICSILGSLLIGAGIILLLAHNWSDLSRSARTVLSVTPMVISQLLAVWMLWSDKTSAAWREGIGLFLTLSIGASISLVAQTYHIPGDLGGFLFSWSLLTLPIIYLLGSSLPAALFLVGITFWAGYEQSSSRHAVMFWPLIASAVPHVWIATKADAYSTRSVWLRWALALCLCVATGITLEKTIPGLWIIVYSSMFAVMYYAGAQWFRGVDNIFRKPLHTVGSCGIAVLALLFTYDFAWDDIGWRYYRSGNRFYEWAAAPDYILTVLLVVAAVILIVRSLRAGEKYKLLLGSFSLLAILSFCIEALWGVEEIPMLIFNVYLFVLGVGTIIYGARTSRLSAVNSGMFVVSALIVARFFDSDMGFLSRGIVFIVLGIGFLTTNLVMAGKMKEKTE